MKYGIPFLLLTAALSVHAEPTNVTGSMTYNIALQNEFGVDKQTVTVPISGETRELKMVGGVVQISPPSTAGGQSVIKFSTDHGAEALLMHTANITSSSEKPLEIAYTICGKTLRFQSPAPAKLEKCPTVASLSEH